MDKDKQSNSIYPQATRGVLANEQVHKQYTRGPINKVRDYSPATLIAMTIIGFILIGVVGVGSFIFIYGKTHKIDSTVASFKIAKKMGELKTTQTSSELESITDNATKRCFGDNPPIITITHEYSQLDQPSHIDTTVVNTGNIKDIAPILESITNKARGARLNTMAIDC